MRLVCIFFLTLVLTGSKPEQGPAFYTVVAGSGDGVYSLLRRYLLLDNPKNIDEFYTINRLNKKAKLLRGKKYKLPVLEYPYNGISIVSSLGTDDTLQAKRVEEYNSQLLTRGAINLHYTESGSLLVPVHVVTSHPKNVSTGAGPAFFEVPLFGPEHKKVELKSDRLKDKVFYIISGHGGPDPGAMAQIGDNTICEDEYAYDVSLRLARNLMQHGATVEVIVQDPTDGIRDGQLLICDKTELSAGKTRIPIRQLERLKQRTHEVNKKYPAYRKQGLKDQIVVCIHVDSRSPQKRQDVFFYYYEPSRKGRQLAQQLQQTFKAKYARYRPDRGYHGTVSSRGLYVLRHTDPPAVYIELANIRNGEDLQRILPNSNRQALANWIFEGLTGLE